MFMGISNYSRDPRQSGNFFRRPLGIATGDDDLTMGILTANAANRGARILVSGSGHGAGVQNDNIRCCQSSRCFQPTLDKLPLYSSAIRLCRSTAKILYVKARHSHIVTYVAVSVNEMLQVGKLGRSAR